MMRYTRGRRLTQQELPSLSSFFTIGQPVIVRVLSKGDSDSKRIECSLDPTVVNSGITAAHLVPGVTVAAVVESVEDHGYVVSCGVKDITCFMPRKEATKELVKGSIIVANVVKKSTSVLSLSMTAESFKESVVTAATSLEMEGLVAGMFVLAKVTEVVAGGVKASVLGIFDGEMEASHCRFQTDLEDHYKSGQKVRCRVLWVDGENKRVGLSGLKHLVEMGVNTFDCTVGDVRECVVKRVDEKVGLLVEIEEKFGYVHVRSVNSLTI